MLIGALVLVLEGLAMICLVDVVFSWLRMNPRSFPRSVTHAITEPMYAPIHAIVPPGAIGGLDFSPIIMIVLLNFLAGLLQRGVAI